MHASYLFLLKMDDPKASEADLKHTANEAFARWAEYHCDENNWSMPKALIMKDNRIFQMCVEDDWRGRDKFAEMAQRDHSKDAFEWAKRFALDCVAYELELFNLPKFALIDSTEEQKKAGAKLDSLSFGDLVMEIELSGAKRLAEMYAAITGPKGKSQDEGLEEYRRRSLATGYEMFRGATNKPFASGGTPYQCRAFDLTYGEDIDENSAILIMDIHT